MLLTIENSNYKYFTMQQKEVAFNVRIKDIK